MRTFLPINTKQIEIVGSFIRKLFKLELRIGAILIELPTRFHYTIYIIIQRMLSSCLYVVFVS